MKLQNRKIWRIGVLGMVAGLFFLIGGMTLVTQGEAYEFKIPLGLD